MNLMEIGSELRIKADRDIGYYMERRKRHDVHGPIQRSRTVPAKSETEYGNLADMGKAIATLPD